MLALVLRHEVGGLRLGVVHAGIGALGLLQVLEHVGEARAAGARDECRVRGVELGRRRRHRHAVGGQLLDPVGGVLVLDVGELEQCLASLAVHGGGQRPVEHGGVALGLQVLQEAAGVVGHRQPLPSVLPASAADGSSR